MSLNTLFYYFISTNNWLNFSPISLKWFNSLKEIIIFFFCPITSFSHLFLKLISFFLNNLYANCSFMVTFCFIADWLDFKITLYLRLLFFFFLVLLLYYLFFFSYLFFAFYFRFLFNGTAIKIIFNSFINRHFYFKAIARF